MLSSINWAKLVVQGRAKAHGVPWSKAEKDALKRGVSVEDVRAGLLNEEDVAKEDKKEEKEGKSLFRMKKDELVALAKELGLEFDESAATRAALMQEISQKQKENEEKKKQEKGAESKSEKEETESNKSEQKEN